MNEEITTNGKRYIINEKQIKYWILAKLRKGVEEVVNEGEFILLYAYLDNLYTSSKLFPYTVFKELDGEVYLNNVGEPLKTILEGYTEQIESSFNKGRKVSRMLGNLSSDFGDTLCFSIDGLIRLFYLYVVDIGEMDGGDKWIEYTVDSNTKEALISSIDINTLKIYVESVLKVYLTEDPKILMGIFLDSFNTDTVELIRRGVLLNDTK